MSLSSNLNTLGQGLQNHAAASMSLLGFLNYVRSDFQKGCEAHLLHLDASLPSFPQPNGWHLRPDLFHRESTHIEGLRHGSGPFIVDTVRQMWNKLHVSPCRA